MKRELNAKSDVYEHLHFMLTYFHIVLWLAPLCSSYLCIIFIELSPENLLSLEAHLNSRKRRRRDKRAACVCVFVCVRACCSKCHKSIITTVGSFIVTKHSHRATAAWLTHPTAARIFNLWENDAYEREREAAWEVCVCGYVCMWKQHLDTLFFTANVLHQNQKCVCVRAVGNVGSLKTTFIFIIIGVI